MLPAVLGLKFVAMVVGLLGKSLRRPSAYLGSLLLNDAVCLLFSRLREGYGRPFRGVGFLLWLPDPAMTLLVPSVLLGAVSGWKKGVALWIGTFLFVTLSYPRLRGENLMRFYWALQGAVFILCGSTIFLRSVIRKITPEEALLLLFSLTGLGEIILVNFYGVQEWWGIRACNAFTYLMTVLVTLFEIWLRGKPGHT